jgi:hypothetical protein
VPAAGLGTAMRISNWRAALGRGNRFQCDFAVCLICQVGQDDTHWKWAHSGAPAAGWGPGLAGRFMLRAWGTTGHAE